VPYWAVPDPPAHGAWWSSVVTGSITGAGGHSRCFRDGLLASVLPLGLLFGGLIWSSCGVPSEVRISDGFVKVRIRGMNRIWALSGGVSFPASAVTSVWVEEGPLQPRGWRMPGTAGFGVIEGTYVEGSRREFWAVGRGKSLVVIELSDQPFVRVVVQVSDPEATVEALRLAVFGRRA